jgi:hypothetical protein
MEQTLHITKLYLVELEDKPSNATPEKLQYHQQLLDHVSRSLLTALIGTTDLLESKS